MAKKHRVALGLRDNISNEDTPYIFEVNGTTSSTGVNAQRWLA